jgi:hemerythrin-like domain-containing protein
MDALEVLTEEHEIILRAISVLEQSTAKMKDGKTVPDQFFNDFIGLIRKFADKCHHGKEETVLFPLIKQKDSTQTKSISALLEDLQKAREHFSSLEKAVAKNDTENKIINAKGYAQQLKSHIERENKLFPTWMSLLNANEKDEVFEKFEEIEAKIIGIGKHEEYVTKIENLKLQI